MNVYRSVSRNTNIDDIGMGVRKIISTDELPSPEKIREEELFSGAPVDNKTGKRISRKKAGMYPQEHIYLNSKMLKSAKILWYIEVDTKPKETSNMSKLMFREELNDIIQLMNLGSRPNIGELENRHAIIWGRKRDKLFQNSNMIPPAGELVGRANQSGASTISPLLSKSAPVSENV